MSKASELMYAVAKAMNGPHYADQALDIDAERDKRWHELTMGEKRTLLQKARIAIAQYDSGSTKAVALERPVRIET